MGLAAGDGPPEVQRLTDLPATRFADFAWDGPRKRLIAVGETHGPGHGTLPQNALWTIPAGDTDATAGNSAWRGTISTRAPV